MNNNKKTILQLVLFGVPAVLSFAVAVFLSSRGGGWLSFIISCPFWSAAILLSLTAIGLKQFVLFGTIGCLAVGGIGLIAGFFGPIIFTPNSNQGPLLGIFITGPAGTLIGTILGILIALITKRFANKRLEATPIRSAHR